MTSDEIAITRLRKAWASAPDGGHEVDAARVFDAVHGELPAAERRAIVDELASNPDAAEAWRLAHALAPASAAPITAPAPARRWRWLSAAAALALAAGLGWQIVPGRDSSPPPAYRSGAQQTMAAAIPSEALLPRARAVLRWTPIEGARYRLRVFTADLQVIEEADGLTSAEYVLTPGRLQELPPGARILWQVEARVSGSEPIVSPTFSARVN